MVIVIYRLKHAQMKAKMYMVSKPWGAKFNIDFNGKKCLKWLLIINVISVCRGITLMYVEPSLH